MNLDANSNSHKAAITKKIIHIPQATGYVWPTCVNNKKERVTARGEKIYLATHAEVEVNYEMSNSKQFEIIKSVTPSQFMKNCINL